MTSTAYEKTQKMILCTSILWFLGMRYCSIACIPQTTKHAQKIISAYIYMLVHEDHFSGEASPTFGHANANLSVFINSI